LAATYVKQQYIKHIVVFPWLWF